MSTDEKAAQAAIREALAAIQRAAELAEQVGYGSQVLGPLSDAERETQYAYDTAMGRN